MEAENDWGNREFTSSTMPTLAQALIPVEWQKKLLALFYSKILIHFLFLSVPLSLLILLGKTISSWNHTSSRHTGRTLLNSALIQYSQMSLCIVPKNTTDWETDQVWFWHLLAVWPWASNLTSPCFSFFISKKEITII